MRPTWTWLVLPAASLAGGAIVAHHTGAAPGSAVQHDWAAIDDEKLDRTFESLGTPDERTAFGDDTSRPVGRPGLRVDLTMKSDQLRFFRTATKNTPRRQEEVAIAFDDGPARTALLTAHGWSTQSTDRKSYVVQLFKRQQITNECRLRKFLLVNLLYDHGSFRMETCYRLLHEMGLFPSYHELVTVFVNGHPEGIYLLVERVEDAVLRTEPEVACVIRRRWNERPEIKFAGSGAEPTAAFERAHGSDTGAVTTAGLERDLDLDAYLSWLGFNSLTCNSDYLDELFLYQTRGADGNLGRLQPVAWDYDGIFHPPAHRNAALGDSILYACESAIDRRVLDDPALHTRYADVLQRLLTSTLTEEHLRATVAAVAATLEQIDTGAPADIQTAERTRRTADIEHFTSALVARRASLLRNLPAALAPGLPPGN